MSDRLYLSCWLKDPRTQPLLHQYRKLLDRFPFSKLAKRGPVMRIYVLQPAEPPLLEREFSSDGEVGALNDTAREFMNADSACEIDTFWDLWNYDPDRGADAWKVEPTPLTISCYGPEFENEIGDHLRIEFGPDARFLPIAGVEGSLRMGQSNLKSLLHLVHEVEEALPLERRQVWSESGANFAEVLQRAVGGYSVN